MLSRFESFKGLNYVRISLVILIALLAISNVGIYISLQSQISSLQTQKESLNTLYQNLTDSYQNLNDTYQSYASTHSHIDSEYDSLISTIEILNTTFQEYKLTHTVSNTEYTTLNTSYSDLLTTHQDYIATHSFTNSEYEALENELETLMAPRLSRIGLHSEDVRPLSESPRLHIYGEVWNVGTDTAYNCELHIVAYQGSVKAVDTEIALGTIAGENRVTIDENVYYEGEALDPQWFITAVWTPIP